RALQLTTTSSRGPYDEVDQTLAQGVVDYNHASFPDPNKRTLYLAIRKRLVKQEYGADQENYVQSSRPREMGNGNAACREDRSHAFKHMRGRVDPGHGLKPGR